MVLWIGASLVQALWEHAEREHPIEACGVIAGSASARRPVRHIPMENSAYSPTFYEFESTALLALYRELDDRDEVPVVIYHSHTSTEAYPSRTDIAYAGEPDAHYVLLSTREEIASRSEFRSFRIVNGEVSEEPVEIIGD
jgi:proteasome lid subunit RPN8/RPN11